MKILVTVCHSCTQASSSKAAREAENGACEIALLPSIDLVGYCVCPLPSVACQHPVINALLDLPTD